MTPTRLVAALGMIPMAALTLAAQQPNASPGAFGMGGNFTAAARNYDAVAWNPANLALPGNSVGSFNVGALGGVTGLGPVTLQDIGKYNGATIPVEAKEAWLDRIGEGRERGRIDGGASIFAMSIRNVALQVGTSASGDASVNRDAAEVLLYGNAGRTGSVREYNFAGSSAHGGVFTTAAAGIGIPLPFTVTSAPDEILTIGVTGKYVVGNAYAAAQDAGSTITAGGVDVAFPIIYGSSTDLGHGAGMDLGIAWHAGRVTAGFTVQNLVNSFAWDTTKLRSQAGTASFDGATGSTSFSDTTYGAAPATMRADVAAQKFGRTMAGGIAFRAAESLLLTADARVQPAGAIIIGPRAQVGAGLEWSGIGFLPIRLGGAIIPDGWQGAAGFGLNLGQNHIGVSGMVRNQDGGRATGAMVNLVAFY